MNFNRKRFSYGAMPVLTRDFLQANASLDFPSVAAAGTATLTITVVGAVVGDAAFVSSASATPLLAGLIYQAYVTAADTVTVRVNNVTAGALDAAAQSVTVVVVKPY